MKEARYLEIGTWKGSSICSAMCNNKMTCVAIDNWSQYRGPKKIFFENFNKFKGENNATFIEKNCWDIDVSKLGKFNIYMYDGNHTETSHFQALNHYLPCLDDDVRCCEEMPCRRLRDAQRGPCRLQAGTLLVRRTRRIRIAHRRSVPSTLHLRTMARRWRGGAERGGACATGSIHVFL